MSRVRVLGPIAKLDAALRILQDEGRVQLDDPARPTGLEVGTESSRTTRRRRQLERVLDDIRDATAVIAGPAGRDADRGASTRSSCPVWARLARNTRREARAAVATERDLQEERQLIERYHAFLTEILPAIRALASSPRLTAHVAVVPAGSADLVRRLGDALATEFGSDFTMTSRVLAQGETALLLVLPREFSERLDTRLTEARVPEVPLPAAYRSLPLEQAVPKMLERLRAIPGELDACRASLDSLSRRAMPELRRAEREIRDWLAAADARRRCGLTSHAFALEGWMPERYVPDLRRQLGASAGDDVVIEVVGREGWSAADAPVTLSNPRLIRPFERLITLMPLPTYGTIDPTPFVAVFFPMIFGMMLGDVGYGIVLAAIALVLWRRSTEGSLMRNVAEIALPCAVFAVIFGVLYGEYLGDLGARLFGLRPLWINREEAVIATLLASLGLGVMHVTLGLVLGAVQARHEHRHAVGRAVSALMILLVVVALLAAFAVLPTRLFTPAAIALLVCFPIVVLAEGVLGTIELFEALGNVLSYARVMAIGTASVVLAVVANRMVGAMGSTIIGLLFALLFHLVNFAIGLFSPAVHAMRLHYVEFFGRFYAPGGRRYEPFAHWRPDGVGAGVSTVSGRIA